MPDLTRRTTLAAAGAAVAFAPLARSAAAGQAQGPGAKIVKSGAGRAIPFPLHPISQLVAAGDMPANVSFFHSMIPAEAPGAPPHVHAHEDEVYFILEGEAHFLVGDRVETAAAGDTVILPRGGFHANWNEGATPVAALVFVSQNSRFEGFFDDVARRVREAGVTDPAQAAALVGQTGAEYGVTIDMSRMPERAKPFFGMA